MSRKDAASKAKDHPFAAEAAALVNAIIQKALEDRAAIYAAQKSFAKKCTQTNSHLFCPSSSQTKPVATSEKMTQTTNTHADPTLVALPSKI